MEDDEKLAIVTEFHNKLMENYEPLDPFIMQLVNENFWDLITEE